MGDEPEKNIALTPDEATGTPLTLGCVLPFCGFGFSQLVEMEVDVPDGMTIEEALEKQGPVVKVLWESPTGEDVEIPRGMNVASMMKAGLIAPFEPEADDEVLAAGGTGVGVEQTPSGVFDPTAVKGAEERSTEVSKLYAKVMANKAKAKAAAGTQNGYNGSEVKESINGSNAWLSGILGRGQGAGSEGGAAVQKQIVEVNEARAQSGHGKVTEGAGMGVASKSDEGEAQGGQEMVGYDFILQDRDDTEGKVAKSARAVVRCVNFLDKSL